MEHHKLDSIDLRILAELQANGRITNVELSRRAKITAPPCLRRMRALEKSGFIQGYHADLDAKSLGFEVTAYVFVGLSSQHDGDLKQFEEQVRSWPTVRECYMLSGEVDFLLKCVATDLSTFQRFIIGNAHRREKCRERQELARHACEQDRSRRADRRKDLNRQRLMSRPRVSGRNSKVTMNPMPAMITGYQSPA